MTEVREQRVSGLLDSAIADGSMPASETQAGEAEEQHTTAMAHALRLEAQLLDVAETLRTASIEMRLLKGPAAAHLDYPDPALRCFADIDVLVRGADIDGAATALVAAGWQRRFPEPRPGFDRRFSKGMSFLNDSGVELDLHRTFVMGPFGQSIQLNDLWEHKEKIEIGGGTIDTLDSDCRLLHACYHAALGDVTPRLVPQRDVVQLLLFGTIDVPRVRAMMRQWQAAPVVATAIRTSWETFGLADVVALSAWAHHHVIDERARHDLAVYHDPDSGYAEKSLAAVHAVPGLVGKFAFVRALAFPSKEYLAGRASGRKRFLAAARAAMRRRGQR